MNHNRRGEKDAIFSLSPLSKRFLAVGTDGRRMLFSGPVSARCHGGQRERADVMGLGAPWLPWRQSVSAIRML